MATQHPSFPSTRPYSSIHGKLPERSAPFGASAAPGRENARIERERQERERVERERMERDGGLPPVVAQLSDEQREEINEAVSLLCQPSLRERRKESSWGFGDY